MLHLADQQPLKIVEVEACYHRAADRGSADQTISIEHEMICPLIYSPIENRYLMICFGINQLRSIRLG